MVSMTEYSSDPAAFVVETTLLAPLDLIKGYVIANRPLGTDQGIAEREFYKSDFHSYARGPLRRRQTSFKTAHAWARGYMANPSLFNEAAEDFDNFGTRLVVFGEARGLSPFEAAFGLPKAVAESWTPERVSQMTTGVRTASTAFIQMVSDHRLGYDAFERALQVHDGKLAPASLPTWMNDVAGRDLESIKASMKMLRAPERDLLAWATLSSPVMFGTALVQSLPFVLAAGCSPAEAFRLYELGVRKADMLANIVGHDIPDEFVIAMVRGE